MNHFKQLCLSNPEKNNSQIKESMHQGPLLSKGKSESSHSSNLISVKQLAKNRSNGEADSDSMSTPLLHNNSYNKTSPQSSISLGGVSGGIREETKNEARQSLEIPDNE